MLHGIRHTILLIEADTTLRRLIALGLQQRGMHVIEASSPTNLPALETQQPSLVVLDVDGEVGNNSSLLVEVDSNPYLSTVPVVVLAWESFPQAQVTCLTKPFDARTLHATIEQILATSKEAGASKAQEVLLASHSASPAPSIWPLITAAGLLLAFIGLMISITLTGLGLLIVMIALFWWTLGPKKEAPLSIEMGKAFPTSVH